MRRKGPDVTTLVQVRDALVVFWYKKKELALFYEYINKINRVSLRKKWKGLSSCFGFIKRWARLGIMEFRYREVLR